MRPAPKFPLGKYGVPGAATVLAGALYALEQWASGKPWWPEMPWVLIFACSITFMLGVLYADLWNEDSQLRRWWSYKRRIFDVIVLDTTHYPGEHERVDLNCLIKFVRDASKPWLVVRVLVEQGGGSRPPQRCLITRRQLDDVIRDQELRFRLGNLWVSGPKHSVWGWELGEKDIKEGQKTITPNSKNIIEISVGHQTYRAFARFTSNQHPGQQYVYLTGEEDAPL